MNLLECREQIDKIDAQIFELLFSRFDTIKCVVEYKLKHNLNIYQ
ncbi:MAG: chorismate mutase [Candidatus Nanoarchaeia archaeon]